MKALEMDAILEPLFAILAIAVPLGLAYIIVLLQSRKPACGCRKESAITHDVPLQRKTLRDFEAHIGQGRRL
ncbi:MAG: hypothetical protein WCF09_02595 [Gallionella sp.]